MNKWPIARIGLLAYVLVSLPWLAVFIFKQEHERTLGPTPSKPGQKTQSKIIDEIGKVRDGDAQAACDLSNYYNFVIGDYEAAYFWIMQAKKLGHPDVTDDVIRALEAGPFSVLPEDPNREQLDPDEILDLLK